MVDGLGLVGSLAGEPFGRIERAFRKRFRLGLETTGVDVDQQVVGKVVARASGRVAGLFLVEGAIQAIDAEAKIEPLVPEGADVEADTPIVSLEGRAHGVLAAERVALNLLGRLCGIATVTRDMVRRVEGTGARTALGTYNSSGRTLRS